MTLAAPTVTVYFGLTYTGDEFFTIEDPVYGLLDQVTGAGLAGDIGSAIDADSYEVRIRRGRSRELDQFEVGTCDVVLHNHDRTYDDLHASSPYFGQVIPGKRITVSVWGVTIFDGTVEDWDLEWSVDLDAQATCFAVDALGQLGLTRFNEWTTTAGQTAGPRIEAALNRSEVGFGPARDLDTGVTTLQADLVTWGSNVLNYLQLVAQSDAGRLFATRENVLRYQDRLSLVNPTSTVQFRDDDTAVPFHGIRTSAGADLLFSSVGVDREGGTLQTATTGARQERALTLSGLLMDSDEQAGDLAEWLLSIYDEPETRIAQVMVKVHALAESQRGVVAALDIGDVVSVSWTPRQVGLPVEQLLVIEGVEHQIAVTGEHVMWIATSVAQQVGVFVIEDDTYGLLDTGGVLAF